LADRYRIVAPAGKGGMGEVYRAEDLKLSQVVALKFVPALLAADGAALARFHREVRVARQVSHPNVCRVFDIGETDGQLFLSMEFVDGEDLSSLLRRIGRLPPDKAVEIARQLCAGLAAAHEHGVLHRDLKPSNVMIDGRGKARITDFGLSGLAGEFRADELRAGTPAYMAPEQLEGKEVTVRSDIYSLGLVLYELFTGKRAFEAATVLERKDLLEHTTPTSPSSHIKDLDPVVERVILRCLENDPRKRPASALQVAAALPGGDPLAAALAAGETPSPEMVAASGMAEGLRPAIAWLCLAGVAVGVLASILLSAQTKLYRRAPLEKPPEVLAEQARAILQSVGHSELPVDTAVGFYEANEYLRYVREHDQSPARWDNLENGFVFWYRSSPAPLGAQLFLSERTVGSISPDDPPMDVSGMTLARLTPRGRLTQLIVVPPQVEKPVETVAPPDWTPLFSAAGLELSQWTPAQPT
jgi:serine/threonine-protein kinase